jgi:hypothetical protein
MTAFARPVTTVSIRLSRVTLRQRVSILTSRSAAFAEALRLRSHRSPIDLEQQFPCQRIGVNPHMVAMQHFAIEDLDRERVLNQPLQCALERPSTVGAVVAGEQQLMART